MTKDAKVTPWDVSGKVNYDKLIKEFGVNHIKKDQLEYLQTLAKKKKITFTPFLRRDCSLLKRI